jgi:hypothetical protein
VGESECSLEGRESGVGRNTRSAERRLCSCRRVNLGRAPVPPEHVAFFAAAEHAVRLRDSRAVYLLPKHDSQIANNASRNKVSRNRGKNPFTLPLTDLPFSFDISPIDGVD